MSGTPAIAQSIEEEISALLASHPQLKAARENVAAAEEGVSQAFSEFLPNVRAFGDFGYERIDSPGRRAAEPDQGPFTTGSARQTSVTITQTLFNGYRNEANNETARLNKDVADIALETNTQGIIFEAVSAYLEVLRNGRLVQLSRDQEANIARQLELEDERVRRGSGITVDVLQSKARLQVAKERRVAFEGATEDAISRYTQVFGHPPVAGELIMPTPPLANLPDTLDGAQDIALSDNPLVADADRRIDLADQNRRIAKSDFFPTVDLVGEWTYEDNLDGVSGARRDYKAKVQATWELFNGFATRAATAQASHQYRASIDTSNFVQRRVLEEVRLAWFGLETARERVRLLQNAVNIAAEVFDARRKLREAGKETVINVLDAENELFNARINLVAAQHDARVAVYRLLLAIGRLTQDNIAGLASNDFGDGNRIARADETADDVARLRESVESTDTPPREAAATSGEPQPAQTASVRRARAGDPKLVRTASVDRDPVEGDANEFRQMIVDLFDWKDGPTETGDRAPIVKAAATPDAAVKPVAPLESVEVIPLAVEEKPAALDLQSKPAPEFELVPTRSLPEGTDGEPNFSRLWPYE